MQIWCNRNLLKVRLGDYICYADFLMAALALKSLKAIILTNLILATRGISVTIY